MVLLLYFAVYLYVSPFTSFLSASSSLSSSLLFIFAFPLFLCRPFSFLCFWFFPYFVLFFLVVLICTFSLSLSPCRLLSLYLSLLLFSFVSFQNFRHARR
jgi:hypothetical protein